MLNKFDNGGLVMGKKHRLTGLMFAALILTTTSVFAALPPNKINGKYYLSQWGEQTFATAINDLNGLNSQVALVLDRNTTLDSNVTSDREITLEFVSGYVITITDNKRLTINGSAVASAYRLFTCVGTGCVLGLSEARPEWFGAVPDDNSPGMGTANWTAINKAVRSIVSEKSLQPNGKLFFGAGKWYITGNAVFNLPGVTYRRGLMLEGVNNGSSILILNRIPGSNVWFFDNEGGKQVASYDQVVVQNLCFRSEDKSNNRNDSEVNGFKFHSIGMEKSFRFYNCVFENLEIAQELSGTGNADQNKWIGCLFRNIKKHAFKINNEESVCNDIIGCDFFCSGDVIYVGASGGGDIKIYGGCVVMKIVSHDGKRDKSTRRALFHLDKSAGTGNGNNTFLASGCRFEIYDHNSSHVISTAVAGWAQIKFDTCDFNCDVGRADDDSKTIFYRWGDKTPSADAVFIDGNPTSVIYDNCKLPWKRNYTIKNTRDSVTAGRTPSVMFYNNVLAQSWIVAKNGDLRDRCNIEGAGFCQARNTSAQGIDQQPQERYALDFDYGASGAGSTRNSLSTKIAEGKSKNVPFPRNSKDIPLSLHLPLGSVIKSISVYRPSQNDKATMKNYSLEVTNGDFSKVYGRSSVGADSDDHSFEVNWTSPKEWIRCDDANSSLIKIRANGGESDGMTVTDGWVLIEYL